MSAGAHKLRYVPPPGRENKFVICEDGPWLLPLQDNGSAPFLVEILVRVLRIGHED